MGRPGGGGGVGGRVGKERKEGCEMGCMYGRIGELEWGHGERGEDRGESWRGGKFWRIRVGGEGDLRYLAVNFRITTSPSTGTGSAASPPPAACVGTPALGIALAPDGGTGACGVIPSLVVDGVGVIK